MAVAQRTTGKYLYEETIANKAVLYISYKVADGSNAKYAWPFLIKDHAYYSVDENWDEPGAIDDASFENCFRYFDGNNLWIEDLRTLSFTSFEELAEYLVKDFVEGKLQEFEGDLTALAIGNRYTVTIFDGPNKIYEKTIFCRP